MKFSNFLYILQQNKPLRTVASLALVIVFVAVSFLLLSIGVINMMQGSIAHCPYMADNQSMCPMTIADHVQSWVRMFSTVLPDWFGIVALIILVLAIGHTLVYTNLELGSWRFTLFRHSLQFPNVLIFEYLRRILSQGILNPKIYLITV
ncbi:MAG: hypothetical protein WCT27_01170 [Patescibacteria group bacterium]